MAYETVAEVIEILPAYGVSAGGSELRVRFKNENGKLQVEKVICGENYDRYYVGAGVAIQKGFLGWKLKGGAQISESLKKFFDSSH